MPIYMDRHDVSKTVTAENVAQLHKADLKIQHEFECRGLTYWFDDERKTAFCLVEAPNEQNIIDMHNKAHGEVPHRVIEVDSAIVESFLGRIEDPEKSQNTDLNIINDPAFRTIMIIKLESNSILNTDSTIMNNKLKSISNKINQILLQSEGNIVKQEETYYLTSFDSVTNAVNCALDIQSNLKKHTDKSENTDIVLKIGLNAGVPVTNMNSIFEDTIKLAEHICTIDGHEIIMTSDVKDLYKSEKINHSIDKSIVTVISQSQEKFISQLMNFIEGKWRDTNLKVDEFGMQLGYSKSQLYRKMISTFGKSPNNFLKNYRLNKAKLLLRKQVSNISEIAFETGFSSPSYFSKCFLKKFGIKPSDLIATK